MALTIKLSPTSGAFKQPTLPLNPQAWVEQGFKNTAGDFAFKDAILKNLEDFVSFSKDDIIQMPASNWFILTKVEVEDKNQQNSTKITLAMIGADANPSLMIGNADTILVGNKLPSIPTSQGGIKIGQFLQDGFIHENLPVIKPTVIPPTSNGLTLNGILVDIKRDKGNWNDVHPFWTVKFSRANIDALANTTDCAEVVFVPIVMAFIITEDMFVANPLTSQVKSEVQYTLKVETLLGIAVDATNKMVGTPLWTPNPWRPNYKAYN
jgi:hypothetical protein